MSKVVRIDEEAIAIALQYGATLSKGIRKMDAIIRSTEKARQELRRHQAADPADDQGRAGGAFVELIPKLPDIRGSMWICAV